MKFEEWWKENGRDFSCHAINYEIKWFAQKAWDAAMTEQERDFKELMESLINSRSLTNGENKS